jgi:selenide,water dikinase
VKRVVLLGGGHSHIEVVRRFGTHPVPDSEITLVDAERFATYSGMLPGLVAGHYDFDDCHIDLAQLAQRASVRFVQARAGGIDVERRQIALIDDSTLDYDLVSIDVGSTPPTAGIAGAVEHAIAVKPFATFSQQWDHLLARARRGELRNIAVVGGGAAGVEIVLAMQFRLVQVVARDSIKFALVSDAPFLVPDHNNAARAALERLLTNRGVTLHLNARVASVEAQAVIFSDTRRIAADATIWAAGAGAPLWFGQTGLALDARGFIAVNEQLQSSSHADVFAAGDCATIVGYDYPKSGVYAVREGPLLAENLRRALAGKRLAEYHPQRVALSLISAGNRYAIASYGPLALEGAWVWRWKDHIDRKFVNRYRGMD